MRPVKQTILATDENPMRGNCFAACLASILELPLEDVPHVMEYRDWEDRTNAWLAQRNLGMVEVRLDTEQACIYPLPAGMLMIVTGYTSRHPTRQHAVIARSIGDGVRWDYVHDPHPDGTFLTRATCLMWLVPLDPAIKTAA